MGGGIVRATRLVVLSRLSKFLLEDLFGVWLREALQNLECVSECGGTGVEAKTALATGPVAAPAPALPEEGQRDTESEEPKTEGSERVGQGGTFLARESVA